MFKLFLFVLLLSFSCMACKKGASGVANNSGNTNGNCTATKPAAENIAIFPADNSWNTDISGTAIDPCNVQIISQLSAYGLKADFGSGTYLGLPIGIPYAVVCGSQTKYNIIYRANNYDGNYGNESDAGPFPVPLDAPVEGNGTGDSHVIVVDIENKKLYELYNANVSGNTWSASSGAVFDLNSNALRTDGWTSADAAGLPIFPGLVRYEEIVKGEIDHAIRFTLSKPNVQPAYIAPARHKVNSTGGQYSLPFGAKLRLKSSFNTSTYPPNVQVILKAMKKYGIILADIGSNMFISGAPDERWNNNDLQTLGNVKASNFEVIKFH
ncbi:MAG: hypothetical protein JWN76_884 [Chitinophagaceae bacterium]|nr:hypothetical protein [Chitinophagaceae bacterium]